MNSVEDLANYYIALLRSVYLVHKNQHWLAAGSNFYGNHLLLDRIAKTAEEDTDLAAEKLIGLFGSDALDLNAQSQLLGHTLKHFSSDEGVETSLAIEKEFLTFSKKFISILEKEGKLTDGLSNLLQGIADHREGAVYLLQQTLKHQGENHMNKKMASRVSELKRIKIAVQSDKTAKIQAKINSDLTMFLINKNWGKVGFSRLFVDERDGGLYANIDVVIPPNAPPYHSKGQYPNGINQFKQEVMAYVAGIVQKLGFGDITQDLTVNGK
jgi:DNA-binding ferritin-like protein